MYLAEEVLFTKDSDFDVVDHQDKNEDGEGEEEVAGAKNKGTNEKETNGGGGGGLWQPQWLKMKTTTNKEDASAQQQQQQQHGPEGIHSDPSAPREDERQWIWMTNLWYDDGDCGPGKKRSVHENVLPPSGRLCL